MKKFFRNVWEIIKGTFILYKDNNLVVFAGNTTLYLLIAVFPFLLSLLLFVQSLPWFTTDNIIKVLNIFLPDVSSVKKNVEQLVLLLHGQASRTIFSFSILTALWSASKGISCLQAGLMKLYGMESSALVNRLVCLFFTIVAIVSIPFIAAAMSFVEEVYAYLNTYSTVKLISDFLSFLTHNRTMMIVLGLPVLTLVYMYLPGRRIEGERYLAGAFLAMLLCVIISRVFSEVIVALIKAASIYGSLSSVFILTLWVKFIISSIYIGACFNKYLSHFLKEHSFRKKEQKS
ncbi:MAG: YihY/virulence factor BrkB family protein [Sphaerochaetaceae bacterium]|nr:YihY/virulence factor BrkB family protein [Sphaerochaetaceae bacterium]